MALRKVGLAGMPPETSTVPPNFSALTATEWSSSLLRRRAAACLERKSIFKVTATGTLADAFQSLRTVARRARLSSPDGRCGEYKWNRNEGSGRSHEKSAPSILCSEPAASTGQALRQHPEQQDSPSHSRIRLSFPLVRSGPMISGRSGIEYDFGGSMTKPGRTPRTVCSVMERLSAEGRTSRASRSRSIPQARKRFYTA